MSRTEADSGSLCPQTQYIHPQEIRDAGVSFRGKLRPGATLTGTPQVTASPSGPLIQYPQVNTDPIYIDGILNYPGEAVLFRISQAVENVDYTLTVICSTTVGEKLAARCILKCRS